MIYNEFIESIIKTRGQWNISEDEYFEAHHIIPLCMGGEGEIRKGRKRQIHPNIIYLYAEEHYIAHKLLAEEHPDNPKLVSAWMMMAYPKGKTKRDYPISREDYKELRTLWSNLMRNQNNFLDENGHPWNFGIPMDESQKLKLSIVKTGVKLGPNSEEAKKHKSEAAKKRFKEHPETFVSGTKDKICITNGKTNTYIYPNDNIPDGYIIGQTRKNNSDENYIKCWTEERREQQSKNYSGCNNPMYKNGYKLSGGNNGHAIYIYTYKNVDYQCRDDLMIELKKEFPSISESSIRRIMSGKYTERISNKYQYVIDNLSWRLKSEN